MRLWNRYKHLSQLRTQKPAVREQCFSVTLSRLVADCRTSFCHIHRHKADGRGRQKLAETGQLMSDLIETIF